jgi:DNA end-binding protein Ku
VRADGDLLALETLFFADEVREPHQQISNLPGRVKLTRQELRMARQLIESMTGPWQPSDYRDTYTDRVNDLIKAKKNNEEFQPADEAPPGAGQRREKAGQAEPARKVRSRKPTAKKAPPGKKAGKRPARKRAV